MQSEKKQMIIKNEQKRYIYMNCCTQKVLKPRLLDSPQDMQEFCKLAASWKLGVSDLKTGSF